MWMELAKVQWIFFSLKEEFQSYEPNEDTYSVFKKAVSITREVTPAEPGEKADIS